MFTYLQKTMMIFLGPVNPVEMQTVIIGQLTSSYQLDFL